MKLEEVFKSKDCPVVHLRVDKDTLKKCVTEIKEYRDSIPVNNKIGFRLQMPIKDFSVIEKYQVDGETVYEEIQDTNYDLVLWSQRYDIGVYLYNTISAKVEIEYEIVEQ